jgi:putative membrane protein
VQFWCSARDTAWTWTWQAYPGVWLFLAALAAAAYAWNHRVGGRSVAADRVAGTARPSWHFFVGLAVLWIALDWPIGALGAGYLASIHMLQFVLIALIAPPALLRGLRYPARAHSTDLPRSLGTRLTSPITTFILFNVVVLVTHLPWLVDRLMRTQLGSMTIDLLWLGGGLFFWWPLIAPVPRHPRFVPPLRILYVIVGLMFSPIMFGLVGFMVYAERPLYGVYELAPPFTSLTAQQDVQLAGAMMSIVGAAVAFVAISVIFFRWSAKEG